MCEKFIIFSSWIFSISRLFTTCMWFLLTEIGYPRLPWELWELAEIQDFKYFLLFVGVWDPSQTFIMSVRAPRKSEKCKSKKGRRWVMTGSLHEWEWDLRSRWLWKECWKMMMTTVRCLYDGTRSGSEKWLRDSNTERKDEKKNL